jgi:3' exoribonuclease, RNase T-like
MKSVMLDIETLGTAKDSAVISIGICAFNEEKGVIASDGWAIRSLDWHGVIDPSTVKWWSQQNEAAREYSFNGTTPDHVAASLIKQFVMTHGGSESEDEVWANDPDFDVVILQSWWKRVPGAGKFPFHYRAARSCRTIWAEAKRLGIYYDGAAAHTVAHNPIDDACNQARAVIQVRKNLIGATRDAEKFV